MEEIKIPVSMERLIETVTTRMDKEHRPKLARMFSNCFTNTYQKTIKRMADGSTFIITGDIPAMWLRDSAAQVRTYLLLAEDPIIATMIQGIIKRQIDYILLDPYANAFNESPNGHGHQGDLTDMKPWIWERKYEIDSLCYPLQLSYLFWKVTGQTEHFNETFKSALNKILSLWRTEQHHEQESSYRFQRENCPVTDTLTRNGKGALVSYTGMTWSGFRPSDDACKYGYLIPANMFAVVVLEYMAEIADKVWDDPSLNHTCMELSQTIRNGIESYGTVSHPEYGLIYAYETDGLGNHNLMDDANVPSLLSAPYLGYCIVDDPLYQRTRKFLLSGDNPYFYKGKAAEGIGSPHTPNGYIWHIALAIQGLTSTDNTERETILQTLANTDGGTGFMHESFSKDDPSQFSREWFSWANSIFSEFLLGCFGIAITGSPMENQLSRF